MSVSITNRQMTFDQTAAAPELAGAPFRPVPAHAHVLEPLIRRAALDPDAPLAAVPVAGGFADVTAREVLARVRAVAKGLIASGIAPGERVVLMSRTRLEWLVVDYAIVATGAVTVPVYETSAAAQLRHIVDDSGATMAIVETEAMNALLDDRTTADVPTFVMDAGGLDDLVERGVDVDDAELDARISALTVGDIATIVYTSGTTGEPKGCVLTHGNLRANVAQTLDALRGMLGADERTLLFLPLAHAFAKLIALVSVDAGVKTTFASDIGRVADEMPLAQPTMIVAVPRVFEKVFTTAEQRADSQGRRRAFDAATNVAIRYSRQRARGRWRVTPWTRLLHAVFDRLVYRKIRAAFGGSLRVAFSGASPLGERLTSFFDGVGVRIFEGYGLTETSPVLTVNRADAWRPGTVGPPVAGTRLRLAPDGEILVKGPQVFAGYWRDDVTTPPVFTGDGWLRTGDLGTFDDGYLRIVGRKKDLIVTAGGKNVSPAPIEDELQENPLVSQALVIGDDRPFVAALVTIDADAFDRWRDQRGGSGALSGWVDHPALRAEIQAAVDAVNARRSRAESIRKFAILPDDFPADRGELTPTMKLRRGVIEARNRELIDALYATGRPRTPVMVGSAR
jgi:long-chain acyl-CoA synthetase